MKTLFITGIGTGVGKTIWSSIITEALQADYWKPVQSGYEDGTDAAAVGSLITNAHSIVHPEVYNLRLPASPHIAAREEGISIDLDKIITAFHSLPRKNEYLVVEGAGGIMVPLNEKEFMVDLAGRLDATVLIVSRHYLGSINHSLLTYHMLKQRGIRMAGWLFNDRFMDYEEELVSWTGLPNLGSIPIVSQMDRSFVSQQAAKVAGQIRRWL